MSHFTVGVFLDGTKTLEELLAPYQENNMGDCPKEFMEFNDVTDECTKEYQDESDEIKIKYSTLENYIEEYHGYKKDEEFGRYGYWENPNKKWDWWQIGGRWSFSLLVKNDAERVIDRFQKNNSVDGYGWVDAAKVKDIEFKLMAEQNKTNFEKRWEEAKNENDVKRCFIFGIKNGDTKESFIGRNVEFSTFAVITSDGKWHEKGKMGWWAMSSETLEEEKEWNDSYYDTFFKNVSPELVFCVVDCHI